MNSHLSYKLIAILLISLIYNSLCLADADQNLEYKVKALYIIRLASFITWPIKHKQFTFKICINSSDPVAVQLQALEIANVNALPLEIVDTSKIKWIKECDFLYLTQGIVDSELSNLPVVTVSSQAGFAKNGGMIEFYLNKTKVRMNANLAAVNKAGIKLSENLIRLLQVRKPLEEER